MESRRRVSSHLISCFLLTLCLSVIFSNFECVSSTTVFEDITSMVPTNTSYDNNTSFANTTTNTTIVTPAVHTRPESASHDLSYLDHCPDNVPCQNLGASCISCKLNYYCVYGKTYTAECTVKPNITCLGSQTFNRSYYCGYGYQQDSNSYFCDTAYMPSKCHMKQAPPETFIAHCRVKEEVLCLGNRTFHKKFPCNWTSGFKWSTALALSITLGGFGVDRFYIGLWRSGIGKLFSFGGLGVWTIVDVVLITVGYVGPHDGSLYIYPWN